VLFCVQFVFISKVNPYNSVYPQCQKYHMLVHRTSVRVNVKSATTTTTTTTTTTDKHKQQVTIRYLKPPPIAMLPPGEYKGHYTTPLCAPIEKCLDPDKNLITCSLATPPEIHKNPSKPFTKSSKETKKLQTDRPPQYVAFLLHGGDHYSKDLKFVSAQSNLFLRLKFAEDLENAETVSVDTLANNSLQHVSSI